MYDISWEEWLDVLAIQERLIWVGQPPPQESWLTPATDKSLSLNTQVYLDLLRSAPNQEISQNMAFWLDFALK